MFPLWNFFLTRRAFTILVIASLLAGGAFALYTLPKESTPEIVIPIGVVTTILPGATAADVERLVTDKLEPAIRNIGDIDEVTSSSRQGVSIITAQFLESADIESAINDLRTAVDGVVGELPSDAETPSVSKVDFQAQPVLMVGVSTDLAPETLAQLGQALEDDLVGVSGISRVEALGARNREIAVIVRSDALARHGLRAEQIIAALRGANASIPAGSLTIDGIDYPVQFEGAVTSPAEIANTPIATPTGTVLLSDVASIVNGYEKTSSISRLSQNGSESSYALTLNIYKSSGGNILTATNNVKERLEELKGTLLTGSEVVIVYDAGDEIRRSIGELTTSGTQTIVLVVLVLFLAIGLREAIVAALAIPFSFVITFIGMVMTGNSINFISLFALVIAIGILVDSAIVMVEGIHTNREDGMEKRPAAQKALQQFSWPLIAGTMTTVAVFVPLFFLSGIIGQFIRSIPFTIVVVLISSIIVTLGFIPTIALRLIRHEESEFAAKREALWTKISTWYRHKMEWLLTHRRVQKAFYGILALSFVGAIALPVTGLLPTVMFPPSDVDLAYVDIELPQATTLSETDRVAKIVEAEVAKTPHLHSFLTTVGSGSIFNPNSSGAGSKFASITLNLEPDRPRSATSGEIIGDLRTRLNALHLSSARVSVQTADGGPPSGAPIVVKVWSNDTGSLAMATEQLENLIEHTNGTRDVASSLSNDGTELRLAIDRAKAEEYGLSAADVASTLRTAIAGTEATKIRIEGEDVAVRVAFDLNKDFIDPEDVAIASADDISRIPVSTARGSVPLGSLLTITAGRTSAAIAHENGERVSEVSSYVQEGENAVAITNTIREEAAKLTLPEDVRLSYGGDDEEIQQTFTEMLAALIAGLVLMFAILVLEFDAFRQSLRLLAAIPLSLTGVLIGLFLMGQDLSFTAFLGIIALAGVIINHGILLLDDFNHRKAAHPDRAPHELVLESAESRVRPIVLTTTTTIIGMIPLTLVSAMWAPLAFTIAFGLLYGTILTLVLIPLLSYRYELKSRR